MPTTCCGAVATFTYPLVGRRFFANGLKTDVASDRIDAFRPERASGDDARLEPHR
jgi:hypothetical protein